MRLALAWYCLGELEKLHLSDFAPSGLAYECTVAGLGFEFTPRDTDYCAVLQANPAA